MKYLTAFTVFLFILFLFPASGVLAVKFLWEDRKGAHIYGCNRYCGKVRVKMTDKGIFRVYSIPFSGDIKASSEKEAAMKACQEIDMGANQPKAPLSNKDEYGCE